MDRAKPNHLLKKFGWFPPIETLRVLYWGLCKFGLIDSITFEEFASHFTSIPGYSISGPISWLGLKKELIYVIKALTSEGFIIDHSNFLILIEQHFRFRDGSIPKGKSLKNLINQSFNESFAQAIKQIMNDIRNQNIKMKIS